MRIQLSMLLASCAFWGLLNCAAINSQTVYAFAAQSQPRTGIPFSRTITSVKGIDDTATILISASTNTCSSTINVYIAGLATYKACSHQGQHILSHAITSSFFRDIRIAQPLSALPNAFCFKSTSFGTRMYISAGGYSSPDISCASSFIEKELVNDVHVIENTLKSNVVLRSLV